MNTIWKWIKGGLMLAAAIVLLVMAVKFWPNKGPYIQAGQKWLISFLAEEPKGKELPDVKTYLEEAEHLRLLTVARTSYNDIWSRFSTWPEVEWVREKSPVLNYVEPQVVLQPTVDGTGATYQLIGSQLQVLLIDEAGTEKWLDINAPIPSGHKLVYWDTLASARADLAMVVSVDGKPSELVPVAQRYADGRNYVKGFCWREDIERQSTKALAPWSRVLRRNSVEAQGDRQIIDRFCVVLERGQTSEVLSYFPESEQDLDRQGWKRCWRLRGAEDSSLKVKVNGVDYAARPDEFVDASEARRPDKSLVIQVTLCRDARLAAEEVPVEFVYYQEKCSGEV